MEGGSILPSLITDSTVESLADCVKLSIFDAKTVIYWRLASKYSTQLHFIPKMALVGPAGSGKTTTMEAVKMLSGESSPIYTCALLTMATARDLLAEYKDKLFIADEADDLKPEVAMLFMARSNRDMSVINYKEAVGNNSAKFKQQVTDVFGPTIIHHRNEIQDPAQSSRSIQVFTHYQDGPYPPFEPDLDALASLKLDMTNVPRFGGRAYTTWAPVLHVARQVGDIEYLAAVDAQVEQDRQTLRHKAEYDTASLVLIQVIEVVLSRGDINRWDRIDVEYNVGSQLRFNYPMLSPMTVASTIRTLGLHVERKGGKLWLYPDRASLEIAARKRGYQDPELDALIEPPTGLRQRVKISSPMH